MRKGGGDIWQRLTGKEVFVVADIGKNFIQTKEEQATGVYLKNARRLIDEAKKAAVDAVKFQTHRVEDEQLDMKVVAPHFTGSDRYSWVKRNSELTKKGFWQEIKNYCRQAGIIFFSTPMSRGAAHVLSSVGVPVWKVGSGDILDFVMLDYLRERAEPIIISSGMSTLSELNRAIEFITQKNSRVVLMHCVSKYPCAPKEINLNTIGVFKRWYKLTIGFSDHSPGIEAACQAVKVGAKVIEKHFSLSRGLWGSDHKVSLEPAEMAELVRRIRKGDLRVANPERFMGVAGKELTDAESVFRPIFRKSLVAGRDIEAGETIKPDMLYAMRPQKYAGGLASEEYERVVGSRAKAALKKYDPIEKTVLNSAATERVGAGS